MLVPTAVALILPAMLIVVMAPVFLGFVQKRGSYGIENCEERKCVAVLRCDVEEMRERLGGCVRRRMAQSTYAPHERKKKGKAPRNMRFWSECLS